MQKEMTAEEFEQFQRDLQTKAPEEPEKFKMPGGGTFADFKREQAEKGREELKEARRMEDAAMRAQSSAVLPNTVRVSIGEDGQLVSQPTFAEPGKPTETVSVAVSETAATVEVHEALRTGPLPEDFPHRDLWVGGGFGTYEALRAAGDDDLLAVDGIGPAKLKESRKALKD